MDVPLLGLAVSEVLFFCLVGTKGHKGRKYQEVEESMSSMNEQPCLTTQKETRGDELLRSGAVVNCSGHQR